MKKKNLDMVRTVWMFVQGGFIGLIWYFAYLAPTLTESEPIRMLWFSGCFTIGLFLTTELVVNVVAEMEYNPGKWPFVEDKKE
jgi:hypothetical protein